MRFFFFFPGLLVILLPRCTWAQLMEVDGPNLGFAKPQGLLFGTQASEEMQSLVGIATPILWVMLAICAFVLALLLWVVFRYNQRANPQPSKTTHSTILEILWTGIPTLIVIVIGFFGVRQLLEFERIPPLGLVALDNSYNPDETVIDINVYGMPSWNWEYEVTYFGDEQTISNFPDYYDQELGVGVLKPGFRFVSNMLEHPERERRQAVLDSDLEATLDKWTQTGRDLDFYQFDVDNRLVIPSGVRINVNVQGPIDSDKQHAWAVPAFGVKRDFWPGRVNPAHFLVPEGNEGLYFGQCSEFCGAYHAYMPIAVHVVTLDEYRAYFASQMAAALTIVEAGGLFTPEYLPVNLPAPYGTAGKSASR